jgi:hypothetical protein
MHFRSRSRLVWFAMFSFTTGCSENFMLGFDLRPSEADAATIAPDATSAPSPSGSDAGVSTDASDEPPEDEPEDELEREDADDFP